jgi:hypothetical protein
MEKSSNSWIIHDSLYKTFCYADTWVIQCRSFGGSSVMVRWGIPERGRTPLVVDGNLTGLRCEIVQCYVIPFIQAQANNVPFQHENARSHVPRVVRDCLTQQNVDGQRFHPTFHPLSIWDEMERQLRHLQNQPLTLSEMDPVLHTHFSPILIFLPGKMSIYWVFPPEKWVYTEISPPKNEYILNFPPGKPSMC